MTNRSVIVFVIDGWSPGHLEAYGSSNVKTPTLNSIASRALLFDHCLADCDSLAGVYDSYLSGTHSLQRLLSPGLSAPRNLMQRLREQGMRTLLLQEGQLPELDPFHASFDEVEIWDEPSPQKLAATIEETRMARFADLSANLIAQAAIPDVTWVHVSSFRNAWDAPREMREALLGDEDPEAPTFLRPTIPDAIEDWDPDLLLINQSAYGAQIAVWDACLDLVWESFLERSKRRPTLLVLTSCCGMSLGEHPSPEARPNVLHSEFIHVPFLCIDSTIKNGAFRTSRLMQPHELYDILLSYATDSRGDTTERLDVLNHPAYEHALLEADTEQMALMHSTRHWAVRTPHWFATFPKNLQAQEPIDCFATPDDLGGVELFAKPDDRWEDNELSHRCPEVVQELAIRGQEFLRTEFTQAGP